MYVDYSEIIKPAKRGMIENINTILLSLSSYAGLVFLILMYKDVENLRHNIEGIFNKTQILEIMSNTDKLEQGLMKITSFC